MTSLRAFAEKIRPRLPALAGYAVPFLLVAYLGLESGGYELVTRSQVGIVVWWAILLGVAAGLMPVIRVTRSGWIALAIMGALVFWTALAAVAWTQSTERSIIEVSRSVTLIGFLLALLLLQGRDGLRRSVGALGAAATLIAVVALASRYHPGWFDLPQFPENYPKARLNHPLGYWNGLATLMAMGIAVLLWSANSARTSIGRAVSAAVIPMLVVATYLTASRGGAIEVGAAIVLLFLITPGRFALLVRTFIPAALSVVLILLVIKRPELRDNLGGPADSQGTQMIWLTLLVFFVGFGLAWVLERLLAGVRLPTASRRTMRNIGIGLAAVLVIVLAGALASGFLGERWDEFKKPVGQQSGTVERLESVSSGERYEQWRSAIDAGETEVVTGLGPGVYEYWWSRSGTGPEFVRDAHSLYLEGFAELGIPGLLLTLGLVLFPIGLAVRRALRDAEDERRPAFAAAAAGMVAFGVAAGIDWAWELTVLPAAFLVLVAAVCGPDAEVKSGRGNRSDLRLPFLLPARVGFGAVSIVALLVIAIPMIGTQRILDSQALYREGDPAAALEKAEGAHDLMPWSAQADIQIALLQAEAGGGQAALEAARAATEDDPYNWQAWYVLSGIAGREGQEDLALEAEAKVRELNRNRRQQKP